MSQIAQVQITFVPAEDRLLMRVGTTGDEEFRFWLTRRYVRGLRPNLARSLGQQPRIRTQASPVARSELLRFEHLQALHKADFATPYHNGAKALPLGEQSLLLTRFQLRTAADGAIVVSLRPAEGNGIDLNLNAQLTHSILALLDTALAAAQWDLATADNAPEAAVDDVQAPALH